MDLTSNDKTAVLLQLLHHQLSEIERRESREQKLFEWSTGLLAAAFGVVVALYEEGPAPAHAKTIQVLATVLVAVPTLVLILRIRRYQKMSIENAVVVERLEKSLLLFERGVYGRDSPYPTEWERSFAAKRLKRKTPFYYQIVSVLMAACVIGAIWLLLGDNTYHHPTSEVSMKRVTGIGGVFFKAKDAPSLQAWYKRHLGIDVQEWGGTAFTWTDGDGNPVAGTTIWSVGPAEGDPFAPSTASFMVNYRVEDLHGLVEVLREEGCNVLEKIDESEYGKFAWVIDPEGNKVELWQPPAGQ